MPFVTVDLAVGRRLQRLEQKHHRDEVLLETPCTPSLPPPPSAPSFLTHIHDARLHAHTEMQFSPNPSYPLTARRGIASAAVRQGCARARAPAAPIVGSVKRSAYNAVLRYDKLVQGLSRGSPRYDGGWAHYTAPAGERRRPCLPACAE